MPISLDVWDRDSTQHTAVISDELLESVGLSCNDVGPQVGVIGTYWVAYDVPRMSAVLKIRLIRNASNLRHAETERDTYSIAARYNVGPAVYAWANATSGFNVYATLASGARLHRRATCLGVGLAVVEKLAPIGNVIPQNHFDKLVNVLTEFFMLTGIQNKEPRKTANLYFKDGSLMVGDWGSTYPVEPMDMEIIA